MPDPSKKQLIAGSGLVRANSTKITGLNNTKAKKPVDDKKAQAEKSKFKMEVDLSALNGRVHFADDEKFMIATNRNIESTEKSKVVQNNSGSHGAVSSYMS